MKTTDFINKRVKKVEESTVVQVNEQPKALVFPEFTIESAEAEYNKILGEDATGGATGSSSVAVAVGGLGNGTQSIIKRQQGYTNQRTKGGTVKEKI